MLRIICIASWFILVSTSVLAQEGTVKTVNELMEQAADAADRDVVRAEGLLRSALSLSGKASLDSLQYESLVALSNTFRQRSMSDSAVHYLMEANTLAKRIENPVLQAKANLLIARIYRGLKLYDKADEHVDLAEKALEGSEAPAWQARILQARSISAWYRGETERSHALIDEAMRIARRVQDEELVQSFQMDQALQYFEDERYEEGFAIYDTLLNGPIRTSTRYTIYHNSITILLLQDRIQEAVAMSNAFLEAVHPDDPGNYVQALFDQILVLEAQGDFEAALNEYFILDEMEDSLNTEELSHALSDMQARFDVEQKESELAIAEAEIENSVLRQRSLTIGLVALVLLLVGGFFYSRQRIQNRALQAEAEQKEKEVYKLRNVELKSAYHQIEEKNREIMDSIEYAKRIQTAILPPERIFKSHLPNSFVLYKPKDVVAGDFFWMETLPISSPPAQGGVPRAARGGGQLNNLPYLKTFRKKLRNNLTPAEARLWDLLKAKQLDGRKFRRQHSVGNYILDFYCPDEKLAIELDGEVHNNEVQAAYDHERTLFLNATGIQVIRFENKLVFEQTEMVLEAIREMFGWSDRENIPPRHAERDTPPQGGGELIYWAAADCTGHGVPGAMVSVICVNGLNRAVREFELRSPGEILDKTRELVIKEFEKSEEVVKDGMDISLCALNTATKELHWAGAHNPLWIVSERDDLTPTPTALSADDEFCSSALLLHELKGDKQPIGQFERATPFTTHRLQLQEGETLYVFTDGYPDQFGGDKGKKYKSGRFKKAILALAKHPIDQQSNVLDQAFESWRADQEQVDDVCVIGVRV